MTGTTRADETTPGLDERVVVLAPSAHDGSVTADILRRAGFDCVVVQSVRELCRNLERGGAVALVAQEALTPLTAAQPLVELLEQQEPWSDLPVLIFSGGKSPEGDRHRPPSLRTLAPLGNVTLLNRPVQVVTLLSAVTAAIRARRRQYGARALLEERNRTAAALATGNDALREADRRKDEFIGMLSHELRNPLAPIRNSIYVLRHADAGSEETRRAYAVIERQTEHLTRLVGDLLDVTRIARGKIELRRERLDLRDVVWRACDDFRIVMHDRGVRYELSIPDEKLWLEADATRITQVIGNLLHNAAKFTRRGDLVALALERDDGRAQIRVRDTGAGIAPELLPRIFDAFVQGERTLARTDGGLGLGLALVKSIVELHGGTVRAESGGHGSGSEFIVTLPLVHAPEYAPCEPSERRARPRRACRVLVVDDNTDSAESLADLARMLGHPVDVAYDGQSALEKVRANAPSVVLCDIGLPGIDGYEVARQIRAQRIDGIQLFAVSGYARADDAKRAIEAGFDGHLAKPCDPAEIARLLS